MEGFKFLPRVWCFYTILFWLAIPVPFYMFAYAPEQKELRTLEDEATNLQISIENAIKNLDDEYVKLALVDLTGLSINHFKDQNIPQEERIPKILKEVKELAEKEHIKFLSITPENVDSSQSYYTRIPFTIEAVSSYQEFLDIINKLENEKKLNISELSIYANPKNPDQHQGKLTISTYEMKTNELMIAKEKAEKRAEITIYDKNQAGIVETIKKNRPNIRVSQEFPISWLPRDPFQEILDAKGTNQEKDIVPVLELEGILDMKGQRQAIINKTYVKEGDEIGTTKCMITRINKDSVDFRYGAKTYTIDLKVPVKGITRSLVPKEKDQKKNEVIFDIKKIRKESRNNVDIGLDRKMEEKLKDDKPIMSPIVMKDKNKELKTKKQERRTKNQRLGTNKDKYYAIQIGSFFSQEIALDLQDRLIDVGYDSTHIVAGEIKDDLNNNVYRVRIGKYTDLDVAKKVAFQLENKEKLKTWITKVNDEL
ncbi:MAG: SPOR domain-containing protein [bacterium]